VDDGLDALTKAELRQLARDQGLPDTGSRAELVERIDAGHADQRAEQPERSSAAAEDPAPDEAEEDTAPQPRGGTDAGEERPPDADTAEQVRASEVSRRIARGKSRRVPSEDPPEDQGERMPTKVAARDQYFEMLLEKARATEYPSHRILDRLDGSVRNRSHVEAYVDLLFEKTRHRYPSLLLLDRLNNLILYLEVAEQLERRRRRRQRAEES
jgi:hypothetical protein